MSPPDLWKWKWSNGVGKSEMSIIWCISITNNVKSNKKINETAEAGNCTDFPLISCGNGLKSTKTMQTFFSQIGIFLRYPGQGSTFHRASSQAELNQNYFLLKCMLRFFGMRDKCRISTFWDKERKEKE